MIDREKIRKFRLELNEVLKTSGFLEKFGFQSNGLDRITFNDFELTGKITFVHNQTEATKFANMRAEVHGVPFKVGDIIMQNWGRKETFKVQEITARGAVRVERNYDKKLFRVPARALKSFTLIAS